MARKRCRTLPNKLPKLSDFIVNDWVWIKFGQKFWPGIVCKANHGSALKPGEVLVWWFYDKYNRCPGSTFATPFSTGLSDKLNMTSKTSASFSRTIACLMEYAKEEGFEEYYQLIVDAQNANELAIQ